MRNIFLGLIAFSILTVSCKKDEKATYLKDEAGNQQANAAANNTPQPSLLNQPGMQSVQSNAAPVAATASGMNPPHGQPGHRCDIPVGQPLNSKPAPAPNGTPQNIAIQNGKPIQIDPNAMKPGKFTADPNTGKPVKTAPGMNPPHGQPGHRCDIPVGQPLNSKPAPAPQPAAKTNVVQTTPPPAPTPAPAQQNLAKGEKPKLNPAHGEPWHNCALKVGDPLP
ncbi:hypothetical protein HNP38_001994 [Chryseobacterium defluvii]|uniref:Uncharacterized protein n=1 Tax=Chryseobacterium defluvii TaxID=160396 RepID=A0A840KFA0_9FLAO|nr:hypothetical protein [Chryseobacterium defluvii]MBB4806698.1 hypothetical protein [Chryseobacterium defluvii]